MARCRLPRDWPAGWSRILVGPRKAAAGHQRQAPSDIKHPDTTPPTPPADASSDIPSHAAPRKLRTSMSMEELKGKAVFSEISNDRILAAPKNPPLQTSTSQGAIDIKGLPPKSDVGSKRGQGEPESRSSSAVKKMSSAFESGSPQVLLNLNPPLYYTVKILVSLLHNFRLSHYGK